MRKRVLWLGILIGIIYVCFATPSMAWDKPLWVRQVGTADYDKATGIAIDTNDNAYLAGITTTSGGGYAWLIKYDPSGHMLWTRKIQQSDFNRSFVVVNMAEDIYLTAIGSFDAWVAKYDGAGHQLWKRPFSPTASGTGAAAIDAPGNVYLAGASTNPSTSSVDVWVTKYDAAGRVLWSRSLTTDSIFNSVSDLTIDQRGNLFLSGTAFVGTTGLWDAWLTKLDAVGHVLWKQQFGTASTDISVGVTIDAANDIYWAGYTNGPLGLDPWLVKYDNIGRVLWKRTFASDNATYPNGVATDTAGNVYLAGLTAKSLGKNDNAWLAQYSAAGHASWQRSLGTAKSDSATCVATEKSESVYIAGTTTGAFYGSNFGGNDAWIAKYSLTP